MAPWESRLPVFLLSPLGCWSCVVSDSAPASPGSRRERAPGRHQRFIAAGLCSWVPHTPKDAPHWPALCHIVIHGYKEAFSILVGFDSKDEGGSGFWGGS